jgi:small subunit ribosomal protein S13
VARIAGVDIPRDKRLEVSLTYIYGIGLTRAQRICAEAGVDPDTRVRNLTDDEVAGSVVTSRPTTRSRVT